MLWRIVDALVGSAEAAVEGHRKKQFQVGGRKTDAETRRANATLCRAIFMLARLA